MQVSYAVQDVLTSFFFLWVVCPCLHAHCRHHFLTLLEQVLPVAVIQQCVFHLLLALAWLCLLPHISQDVLGSELLSSWKQHATKCCLFGFFFSFFFK